MGRLNGLEIGLTLLAFVGLAWLMDASSRFRVESSAPQPVVSVVPQNRSIVISHEDTAPASPSSSTKVRTSAARDSRYGRRSELRAIPLPLETREAAALIQRIREPVPGGIASAVEELPVGGTVLVKVKTAWRLGVVLDATPEGTARVKLAGRDSSPARYKLSELSLVDPALLPHVTRTGEILSATDDVQPGMILEALRPGLRWRSIIVLRAEENGDVAISYIGWDRVWDEIVPRTNLRYPTGVTVD